MFENKAAPEAFHPSAFYLYGGKPAAFFYDKVDLVSAFAPPIDLKAFLLASGEQARAHRAFDEPSLWLAEISAGYFGCASLVIDKFRLLYYDIVYYNIAKEVS